MWNGMIRFGLTNKNPESLRLEHLKDVYDLPKYVYPDLTNKQGYWADSMPPNSIKENDTIYFCLNSLGELHYGINNRYQGLFLRGIEVYSSRTLQLVPLWAVIDIYGNTLCIQIESLVTRPTLINNFEDSSLLTMGILNILFKKIKQICLI